MDSNNWLKQLMMLGVGTTSLVAEKVRQVSDELVRDGKLNLSKPVFVDDMMQQLKSDQGNFEVQMQRLRNMMQELLGYPASRRWTNGVGLTA